MQALQRPNPLPYGIPSWDNKDRNHLRKIWKEERAWYSQNYAQHLPRRAKKKLMRKWAEETWESPEYFMLQPISYKDPIRRQFLYQVLWRPIPGAYVSPLAPTARRKRQRSFYKKLQRRNLYAGQLQSNIKNPL